MERALALADAEGLDAVTIRRLGQEFGVTPMALYWHVKNKEELLDAMGDRLYAGLSVDADSDADWDVALTQVTRALVAALRAHPACTDLAFRRVFACPEGLHAAEYLFAALRRGGFSRRETADIASHALHTAVMLVSTEPGAEPGQQPEEREQILAEKRAAIAALPADTYPHIRDLADELLDCDDTSAYYQFGVDVFVGGARAMHAARTAVSA